MDAILILAISRCSVPSPFGLFLSLNPKTVGFLSRGYPQRVSQWQVLSKQLFLGFLFLDLFLGLAKNTAPHFPNINAEQRP